MTLERIVASTAVFGQVKRDFTHSMQRWTWFLSTDYVFFKCEHNEREKKEGKLVHETWTISMPTANDMVAHIRYRVLRNTFGFVEWRQGFPLRPIAFAHNLFKLVFICILFVRTILNPILSPFCHFECILLHKSHLFMEFGLMWWYLKNCALIQVQYALWVNASIFHVSPRPANPCFFQPISWNTTCANIETIIAHFPCTQCNVFNDDV